MVVKQEYPTSTSIQMSKTAFHRLFWLMMNLSLILLHIESLSLPAP